MSKRPPGGVGVGGLLKGPDSSLGIHIVVGAGTRFGRGCYLVRLVVGLEGRRQKLKTSCTLSEAYDLLTLLSTARRDHRQSMLHIRLSCCRYDGPTPMHRMAPQVPGGQSSAPSILVRQTTAHTKSSQPSHKVGQ